MKNKNTHEPVLLDQVLQLLDPQPGESYLDATAGFGGHAGAIIDRIGADGRVVLVDRDPQSTRFLEERFGDRASVIKANYLDAAKELVENGSLFDLILLDLGVSSPQIDNPDRGFSFKASGPLDMRMDPSQGLTAADVVNSYTEVQLVELIRDLGEERFARRVARCIVASRPLYTTTELADVVRRAVPRSGHIDPATRTFQAVRIVVNDELDSLGQSLGWILRLLNPGGRVAAITFHSLEDRIVKNWIEVESRDCICPPKSPICTCKHQATLEKLNRTVIKGEILDAINPRARSAKLRAAKKINKNQKEDQK